MSRRESDNYARRMARATVAAAVLHAVLVAFFSMMGALAPVSAIGPVHSSEEPLVLNLQPEMARNFVDTAVPADEEVQPDTDLISDKASKASDLEASEGARLAPRLDRISDMDDLAGPVTPAPSAPPTPSAPEAVSAEPQTEPQETVESEEVPPDPEELEALTTDAFAEETMPERSDETAEQTRQQLARAQPQPETAPAAPPQPHLGVA
ncbi:MAG: hypothetical protein R6V12_03085, partial [Candidatus Hydrogenedentota bacterium]